MGIINLTSDSFYEKSRIRGEDQLKEQLEKFQTEGAQIIDLGASSSRPGAVPADPEEETEKILWALRIALQYFPHLLYSIDSWRAAVAREALLAGASMINDISAGQLDPEILNHVAQFDIPYIAMHMRGTPETMNQAENLVYEDPVADIIQYFAHRIRTLERAGVYQILVDPGFGFSKNIDLNFKILKGLSHFKILEKPLLVGISRKSMIYKTLDIRPDDALNGSTVIHTIALMQGACFLRVHDVREAVEAIKLYQRFKDSQ